MECRSAVRPGMISHTPYLSCGQSRRKMPRSNPVFTARKIDSGPSSPDYSQPATFAAIWAIIVNGSISDSGVTRP